MLEPHTEPQNKLKKASDIKKTHQRLGNQINFWNFKN